MFLDSKPQKVVVLGDIFLDYTVEGVVQKLANEAPIPVFLKQKEKVTLGGCGNVIQNLIALGCEEVHLFGVSGNDVKGRKLQSMLHQIPGVYEYLQEENTCHTISKHRFFCNNKLMFRYDEEELYSLSDTNVENVLHKLNYLVETNSIDTILFSDYNKGFLTHHLCQSVIKLANEKGIFTCVDPKNDYSKYIGCSLFKPNRNEVQQLFQVPFSLSSLEEVHAIIKQKVQCKTSVITLGELGISASLESGAYFSWCPEQKEVNDVTGAGDVVNAVLSYFYNQYEDKSDCLKLASYLATLSVQHVGTYTLQFSDLVKAHKSLFKTKQISSEILKRMKKPIVFTNGCFDIVHEGHMSLLEYCKELAGTTHDVVVALNSDTSIQSIKGASRPICNQTTRMAILNAIEYVDWIVLFDDSTPYNLLKDVQPDILVKGGDYTYESIIGKEFCKDVKIFPFTQDISTTKIVQKAIQSKLS
jgi:D-beta-D-heptose 7-phosphate kinase/D-beta-D-heptose 1-phosphate adenosyltransferase